MTYTILSFMACAVFVTVMIAVIEIASRAVA